ncbi:Ankyrin repeat domain-containing protein 7 [Camelus dromedarius]|uniref:Ankyrin repeat domain-containing protein 7 n=1 Tax=Camelus dromedarius TaxID=9838 RepID=A0A5N4DV49_CAMDR|nr:Ankyrin repeat domain-containing protein 7 [Camelus dromedarius]
MKKVIKFTSWVGLRNLERPEPSYITDKRELPKLHRAACSGYDETLRKLLSRCSSIKVCALFPKKFSHVRRTPLHLACISGCPGVVALLIQFNCDLNARDKERTTALIRSNLTPFLLAVKENKKEMVRFLIENGANVHAVDNVQRSALILAVFHDSPDIVKLLLQEGVSPYSQDSRGWSAEQYAYSNGFEQ